MDKLLLSLRNDNRTYFSLLPREICGVISDYFQLKVVGKTTIKDLMKIYYFLKIDSTYRVISKNEVVLFKCDSVKYYFDYFVFTYQLGYDNNNIVFGRIEEIWFGVQYNATHRFDSDYEIHYIPPSNNKIDCN